jgi:hypothetical protein
MIERYRRIWKEEVPSPSKVDRKIFISYSWGDGEGEKHFARAVADALLAHNFDVWLDKRHLGLGEHIDFSIAAAVSEADCFLIFLSKEGLGRIKSGRGGFTLEIEKILTVRNARRRSGHDTKIVIVTLDQLLETELTGTAQLQDVAGTLRFDASEALAIFRSTDDKESARPVAQAIIRDVFHSELILFPRRRFLLNTPDAYPLSWIGSGGGSEVAKGSFRDRWDSDVRYTIPIVNYDAQPVLRIDFAHNSAGWWSAVLFFDQDADSVVRPISLEGFSKLTLDLRYLPPPQHQNDFVPVRIRLEEASHDASAGSFRNSIGWQKPDIKAFYYFTRPTVDLGADFDWTKEAWYWNTRPPSRGQILCLVIGHDSATPACQGVLEIRKIAVRLDV